MDIICLLAQLSSGEHSTKLEKEVWVHSYRVAVYMQNIVQEIALYGEYPEKEKLPSMEEAFFAGLLHDSGKLYVPSEILFKPSSLTIDEMSIMQQHPLWGKETIEKALSQINDSGMKRKKECAVRAALFHHEYWNGKGYPLGVGGKNIPLIARICAVADVFDALTTERSYKKAWSRQDALEAINEQSGFKFDPTLLSFIMKDLKWTCSK